MQYSAFFTGLLVAQDLGAELGISANAMTSWNGNLKTIRRGHPMNKTFVIPLILLVVCGNLPSINPLPTITATVTVTATPETTNSSIAPPPTKEAVQTPLKTSIGKTTHQIRFEGKKGTKVKASYVVMDLKNPTKIEEVEGVLPFVTNLDLPSDATLSVGVQDYGLADDVKPKVFIFRYGKDCGKVSTVGSGIKNPEASKACSGELNLGQ